MKDREEALIILQNCLDYENGEKCIYPMFPIERYREALKTAIEALNEQRPHGEWKEYNVSTFRGTDEWGEPKWGKGKKFICKRCGRRTAIRENFCPNCGSDNRPKSPCDHCIDDSDCDRCDVPRERR